VRRFTTEASRIIKLIPGDVGRPITDLASDLNYPELTADAREVLRTLVFSEKSIAARDGLWFLVRILPYRTLDDRIEGVVITFMDITAGRRREQDFAREKCPLGKSPGGKTRGLRSRRLSGWRRKWSDGHAATRVPKRERDRRKTSASNHEKRSANLSECDPPAPSRGRPAIQRTALYRVAQEALKMSPGLRKQARSR